MSFKLKKLRHLFILWIFSVSLGYGQIPNPSFESISSCPTQFGAINKAVGWDKGCGASNTPDLFVSCATIVNPTAGFYDVGVPFNDLTRGLTNGLAAHQGNNYIHLRTGTGGSTESIKANFTQSLILGKLYKIKLWAALPVPIGYTTTTPFNINSSVELRLLNTASGTVDCNKFLRLTLSTPPTAPQGFTQRGQWTEFEATFRVSDLMLADSIPLILDNPNNNLGVHYNFKQTFEIRPTLDGILIDDMSLTEVPCNLNPAFSYTVNCDKKSNQAVIDVIGNVVNQNSQWNLYEVDSNGNIISGPNPIQILFGQQAQFRVPNIAGKYYMIKHGVWENYGGCPWAEQRRTLQIPTFSNYVNSGFSHSHSGNTAGYSLTVNALDQTNPYSRWALFASPVSLPTTSPNWYSSPVLLGVSGNSYIFTNLQYNMYYMVRHVSKHNCSDYGRTDQVFYISATGKINIVLETYTENISLEEIEKMEKAFSQQNTAQNVDIKIYPNPAKEQVSISGSENSKVLITNQYGKVVYENNLSGELMINIANWKKGLYFVNIDTSEGKIIKKLIVE